MRQASRRGRSWRRQKILIRRKKNAVDCLYCYCYSENQSARNSLERISSFFFIAILLFSFYCYIFANFSLNSFSNSFFYLRHLLSFSDSSICALSTYLLICYISLNLFVYWFLTSWMNANNYYSLFYLDSIYLPWD